MQYGSKEYCINASRAARLEEPSRTITVLMDKRPQFSQEAARDLICAMMDMGYLVREITVRELLKGVSGFMLVLPHAESVPSECAEALESYWKQGGRILVLGGWLFGNLIEPGKDGYEYRPLKKGEIRHDAIDAATSGKMYPIVMEGFTHTAKVYKVHNIDKFVTENQDIVKGTLAAEKEDLVCPQPRNHGHGYDMGHLNRFIPLVQAMGEGGRANGLRGAAVFVMLSDIVHRAHHFVDDDRLGYVKGTSRGACAAGIGFRRQDIMNIEGMHDVLKQLLRSMQRGIYLFEAGSDRHIADVHEKIRIGAKIMNLTMDYKTAAVEFIICKDGRTVHARAFEDLVHAADITAFSFEYETDGPGEYSVETHLIYENAMIDSIVHTFSAVEKYTGKPEEFVRIQDGEFTLNGKQWRAFGINYWPLYSAGLEWNDYWYGWLDRRTYDPVEIEQDLTLLEKMGINCLCTRLDGNPLGHCIDTMRDFVLRCRRHGMKLMVSFCNATGPQNFQANAFERYMRDSCLLDEPVLFALDIGWEVGAKFFNDKYVNMRDSAWEQWLIERYGSIENAEKDWGVPADRTDYGQIIAPPAIQFTREGNWRIKVCAYRRFLTDYISRKWNDCLTEMRTIDPKHLYTCRTGAIRGDLTMALNCGVKHVDFTAPEGWRMPNDDEGMLHAYVIPLAMKMYSGNKPVIWAEYGYSSCEMGYRNFTWDYDKQEPFDWAERDQMTWFHRFFSTHKDADINGTSPWWFPGGLRFSELSWCGCCTQDGQLTPWAKEYEKLGRWFKKPFKKKKPDYCVMLDDEQYASFWGHFLWGDEKPGDNDLPVDFNNNRMTGEVRGEASLAVAEALSNGKKIAFRTPGTGTTSATMPMVAVGNVPLTGSNPPKYLDSEFNYLEIKLNNGKQMLLKNGMHVNASRISLRASTGNIQHATWLRPDGEQPGGVYLAVNGAAKACAAITEDTPYLSDATTEWLELSKPGTYVLRMEAKGIGSFGETWKITLE